MKNVINYLELASDESGDAIYDAFPNRALVRATITPQDQRVTMLEKVKARVLDETILETNAPFFWRSIISSSRLDSHFTRMHESSLKQYAIDAELGVAALIGHNHWENPIGRSLTGQFNTQDSTVVADFYTLQGLQLNGAIYSSTDQIIDGVRSGVLADVSIGFKRLAGFQYKCSICGEDIWRSYECPHLPGTEYPIDPENKGNPDMQLCFAWVINAGLSEVSFVYDGSNMDAVVLKATRMALAGTLAPEVARFVEQTRRVHLPSKDKRFALAKPLVRSEEKTDMENEEVQTKVTQARTEAQESFRKLLRACLKDAGFSIDEDSTTETMMQTMRAELPLLRTQAKEGKEFRKSLIEDALKEGVRAFGDKFDQASKQTALEASDVPSIRAMMDSWKEIADARIPTGRQSVEKPEKPDDKPESRAQVSVDEEGIPFNVLVFTGA